ncbi:MAG: ABC transporter permease, partial [Candidatus Obscuribacterales bacterium]|nr:ABC transporter permease [Candidatus Obscuribacterales bacterium]
MKKIFAQAKKELSQFVRDKLTVALAFVLPFLSLLLFGYGVRLEIKNISLVVQNFDNGLLSYDFVDRLYNNAQFDARKWKGDHPLESALDTGYAKAAVIIPPEFSREIKQGHQAKFQVLVDATDVNNARVIKNSIIGTANGFAKANRLISDNRSIKPSIRLWFNPGRLESLYVVPGALAVVLWIFPSLLASLAMVREKESGTILQVYASSITAVEFIGGKILAYLLIAISMAVSLLVTANILFNIAFVGDPTPYLLGILFFLLSAVSFGTMIGVNTTSQSSAVQAVATGGFTTSLLLSGYLYPIRNIVYPLSLVTGLVPARWFVQLSRDSFVRGGAWNHDWYLPIFLAISAMFFFSIAFKNIR